MRSRRLRTASQPLAPLSGSRFSTPFSSRGDSSANPADSRMAPLAGAAISASSVAENRKVEQAPAAPAASAAQARNRFAPARSRRPRVRRRTARNAAPADASRVRATPLSSATGPKE
ncbi:hypothetical protein RKD37_000990 [Streptomyces ambofaciens]